MTTTPSAQLTTTTAERPGVSAPGAGRFLMIDAALTGANGIAYVLAGGLLAEWFGTSQALVRSLGVFLLVVAVGVTLLSRRTPIPRRGLAALAWLNIAWVLASLGYALLGGLTTLGVAWTLVQAGVVGGFAAAQVWLARRG